MITNENSVYPILEFDAQHGWDSLLMLVKPQLDVRGLPRLKAILENRARCVVIEREYIDKDYRDTFSHFHSKRFNTPGARCVRLHFFDKPTTENQIAEGGPEIEKSYLGYSVIRPTKPNCVGRTMLTNTLRTNGSGHVAVCSEKVHLLGTKLQVNGFPFISQDTDATVCAESALWMLLRYYSNRYSRYSEITPFQITNLVTRHSPGRRVYPSGGLFSWQLAEDLRLLGFSPLVYGRVQFGEAFDHLLYTYVESGLPLLATLSDHVVTAFGHFSDYSAKPRTGASYTSEFNRAFIINDDNRFPYQALRLGGPSSPMDSKYSFQQIEEFIVPLPEKAFLPAEDAQSAIEAVLDGDEGILKHSSRIGSRPHIRRLFLTSSRTFKRSLKKRGMGSPFVASIYRRLPMPHFIWVCELAEVSEYKQSLRILGEVLWDATRNAHELDGWTALHYPEKLLIDSGSAFNSPQNLDIFPLIGSQSYPLYQSNLNTL